MSAEGFRPAPVEPLSFNKFEALYGGGIEEFSIHSLAYRLQQLRSELSPEVVQETEGQLMHTRYNANAPEQLKLGGV